MDKEYRDLWTIVVFDLDWIPDSNMDYLMVMLVLVSEPHDFVMARKPPQDYRGHNRMRYYRNILN